MVSATLLPDVVQKHCFYNELCIVAYRAVHQSIAAIWIPDILLAELFKKTFNYIDLYTIASRVVQSTLLLQ